jgi:nucleoside-diphosphate-sugar epimerase
MKVFITGGSGFIGRRLVNALNRQGHAISVLSRSSNRMFLPGIQVVKGDLTSESCPLEQILEGCDLVFHCAGEIHDVAAMKLLHADGTQRLLKAVNKEATKSGKTIHWVQLSSVGTYGPPLEAANTERVVTEDMPTRPHGEYEVTKTLSDELVIHTSESRLMTYSIVRPSTVFSVDMSNESLRSLGLMVRKGLFFYIGRPGAVVTYVHVDDVVEVLLRCGTDHRAKGEIFNISNDCLLEEMVEGIASALGVKPPRLRLPESFVRVASRVTAKIPRIPLTQERINALVGRTRYPYLKLEQVLDFTPRVFVPGAIGEVVLGITSD